MAIPIDSSSASEWANIACNQLRFRKPTAAEMWPFEPFSGVLGVPVKCKGNLEKPEIDVVSWLRIIVSFCFLGKYIFK